MAAAGYARGSALDAKADAVTNQQDFQKLVLACNKDGMGFLRQGAYKESFEQLKYAEQLLLEKQGEEEPTDLMAVTCNNLGCYYKKVGKLHAALKYLKQALKVEVTLQTDDVTVAGTHLNICAILSKLDKHDKAVTHATCALDLISNRVNTGGDAVTQDEYSVMAIAYHNVAVERDFMHQWDQARAAYQRGHDVARKCLGENHPLTQTLGKNCDAAQAKAQKFSKDRPSPTQGPGAGRRPGRPPAAPSKEGGGGFGGSTAPGANAMDGVGNAGIPAALLPDIPSLGAGGRDASPGAPRQRPGGGRATVLAATGPQHQDDWTHAPAGATPSVASWGPQQGSLPPIPPAQMAAGAVPPSPATAAANAAAAAAAQQHQQGVYDTGVGFPQPLPQEQLISEQQEQLISEQQALDATWGSVASMRTPVQLGGQSPYLDMYSQAPAVGATSAVATGSPVVPAAPPASPPPLVMTTGREKRQKAREDRLEPTISQNDFLTPREQQQKAEAREEKPEPSGTSSQSEFLTPRERRQQQRAAAAAAAAAQSGSESGAGAALAPTTPDGRPPRGPRGGGVAAIARREMILATNRQAAVQQEDSKLLRKTSAVKIQRAWRAHVKWKLGRKDQKKQDQAAAILLQSRFRAHSVRFAKKRRATVVMQKWARGFLVRLRMKQVEAARVIQRYVRGVKVRRYMRQLNKQALKIQRRVRGTQGRSAFDHKRVRMEKAAITIESGARMWTAMAVVRFRRRQRDEANDLDMASTRIQSCFRGRKGRKKARVHFDEAEKSRQEKEAAIKIQSAERQRQADRKVESLRQKRLAMWFNAACIIQKDWLRYIQRKRYLNLRREFRLHEPSVITIQRYVRGFLVRSRMWRDAIRTEEELWAAVEIQRCWRGYQGRVRWELEYEAIWSREAAAVRLQRHIRGWLSRTRVVRIRKRAARAEFEKARRRFKAAQKIQALVRGVQTRKRIAAFHRRKTMAATHIQRVHRGHRQRCILWAQVLAKRAGQIQALARGFLVRARRRKLLAKVIMIQRLWRRYLTIMPEAEREERLQRWRLRRQKARQ